MKVWNLMKSWGHGNKAFRIIATLPLFALATQLAFRRRKYKLNYNTTEHVFIQAYIACQILLLSIIVLPFNGYAKVDDLYELPLWLISSYSVGITNNCTAAPGGEAFGALSSC